jgi:plastocyanin
VDSKEDTMRTSATLPLVLTAVALAGCGGGGSKRASPTATATAAGGATTLKLAADKTALKFDKSTLTAPAGKVTIVMSNPSMLEHNVAIEGGGLDSAGQTVGHGGTSTVTANLKPGTYTFFCAVDGHRQAGMQGTLTITG